MEPKENGKDFIDILTELSEQIGRETDPDKQKALMKRHCEIKETVNRLIKQYADYATRNAKFIIEEDGDSVVGWVPEIGERFLRGGLVKLD